MSIFYSTLTRQQTHLAYYRILPFRMRPLPPKLLSEYRVQLNTSDVDRKQHAYFLKWLRYSYDFCCKYLLEGTKPETSVAFRAKQRCVGRPTILRVSFLLIREQLERWNWPAHFPKTGKPRSLAKAGFLYSPAICRT